MQTLMLYKGQLKNLYSELRIEHCNITIHSINILIN